MRRAALLAVVALLVTLPAVFAASPDLDEKLRDWAFPTRHQKGSATYQTSESVSVKLGIRDKLGPKGAGGAVFIVLDAKGKEYRAKAKPSDLPEWSEVRFPEDFGTGIYAPAGEYTWHCELAGKVVLRGRFQYATTFDTEAHWTARVPR